jgi:site-specific DNA-cytosine methylase
MLIDGRRINDVRVYESPVQTLEARMGTGGNNTPMVAFSHTQGLDAQPSESAWPTLRKEGNGHAVAYDEYNDALGSDIHHALRAGTKQSTGVVVGTLRSGGDGGVPSSAAGFKAGQGAQSRSIGYQEGMAQTLTSDMNGLEPTVLTPTMVVRRLTPLECERLMGWPDNHTRHKADGTIQADTHRYKQCGNGVASPVAQWIGEQLINL